MQASRLELTLQRAKAGDQQAIAECLGWAICEGMGWTTADNLLAVDAYLVDGCFVLNFASPQPLPKEFVVGVVRRELPGFALTGITRVRVCAWRTQAQAGQKVPVWSSDFRIDPQYRRAAKSAPPPSRVEPATVMRAPGAPRRPRPRRQRASWFLWLSVPLFGLLGALVRLGLQPPAPAPAPVVQPAAPPDTAPSAAPPPTPTPTTTGSLSLANFEKVTEGMDLATVQALLGPNGRAIAETEVAGSKAQVFSWKNPDGSNAIVEFRDGKVTAKAQAGLL